MYVQLAYLQRNCYNGMPGKRSEHAFGDEKQIFIQYARGAAGPELQ